MSKTEGGKATSTGRISPPLKWHVDGGKAYLADRIVKLMPPHLHFVEPYFGGGSVLLAKNPEGVSEVVNDINKSLASFWAVLQSDKLFPLFQRAAEATPFSEREYVYAAHRHATGIPRVISNEEVVGRALDFFIHCRQSLAGRMTSFTGITRTRTRRGMNNEVSAWLSAVEGLPLVHARLKRVLILNRPALDVIRGQDGPQTLFYLDPPYLHETRVTTADYAHEMTTAQHIELLGLLSTVKGKFLLSGYRSKLYDSAAESYGWKRHDFKIANHAAGGVTKRKMIECVWVNF